MIDSATTPSHVPAYPNPSPRNVVHRGGWNDVSIPPGGMFHPTPAHYHNTRTLPHKAVPSSRVRTSQDGVRGSDRAGPGFFSFASPQDEPAPTQCLPQPAKTRYSSPHSPSPALTQMRGAEQFVRGDTQQHHNHPMTTTTTVRPASRALEDEFLDDEHVDWSTVPYRRYY